VNKFGEALEIPSYQLDFSPQVTTERFKMRLMVLNVWGGNMLDKLADFVSEQSDSTHIFCFQEVLNSKKDITDLPHQYKGRTLSTLTKQLNGFKRYFTEPYSSFGERLATFVRDDIQVQENSWETLVPQRKTGEYSIGSNLQYVTMKAGEGEFLVANVHGFWIKGNNGDTTERIDQSKKIIRALARFKEPKILCGDFNLAPDTKSIGMLEGSLNNLTKKHAIETTRSTLAEKSKGRIVDYVFVSPEIEVRDFKIVDSKASDHLALRLDFQIFPTARYCRRGRNGR
jgi:endonuclease/exonuclease/phosphatase family metal-dependent hydrolase